jgi:hypothetical protein
MDRRFDGLETRFDRLEMRFDRLEMRFDGLERRFDTFAGDTQQRLERIEGHLERKELKAARGSSHTKPRRTVARLTLPKRRKKT